MTKQLLLGIGVISLIGCGNTKNNIITKEHNNTMVLDNSTHTVVEHNNTVYLPSRDNLSIDIGYTLLGDTVKVEFMSSSELTDNDIMLRHERAGNIDWELFTLTKVGKLYRGIALIKLDAIDENSDRLCVRESNNSYYVCENIHRSKVVDSFAVYDVRDEPVAIFKFNIER